MQVSIFNRDFRSYSNQNYPVAEMNNGLPQVRSKMTYEENYSGAGLNGSGGSCRPMEEFHANFDAIYDCDQVNNIINSASALAERMARLDNQGPESAPVKPSLIQGILHPSLRSKYEVEKKEWDSQLHGQDLDPRPGHVKIEVPGFKGQLSYTQGPNGTIQAEQMEYDTNLRAHTDGTLIAGSEELRHGSMLRTGQDLKFGMQAISFYGSEESYQELSYNAAQGTISSTYDKPIKSGFHDLEHYKTSKSVFGESILK